jgi:homoserine O-acetyltransferase
MKKLALLVLSFISILGACAAADYPAPAPGDFVIKNFKFKSGETLPELSLHYVSLGTPQRDANGKVTNAVLILHGTGGSGNQFINERFAGVLFGPGQLLDATRYFIVLPDNIGHGQSTKPSDGLHARFPQYDYDDMVALQHQLLTDGLKVNHLRLILGTSMGCMHGWVWGETYPDFMDALMPLACLPVQISGRNRMMRRMAMDSIREDPAWNNGDYTSQPRGLKSAMNILMLMSSIPLQWQKEAPTRDQADQFYEKWIAARLKGADANDMLYAFNSSRNYDPSPKLQDIRVPVMAINSADDQINPPELGIMEEKIKSVKHGRYVLLPITDQTRGHGTHTLPAIWKQYLQELLQSSEAAR